MVSPLSELESDIETPEQMAEVDANQEWEIREIVSRVDIDEGSGKQVYMWRDSKFDQGKGNCCNICNSI
jgi:hypothetical protein